MVNHYGNANSGWTSMSDETILDLYRKGMSSGSIAKMIQSREKQSNIRHALRRVETLIMREVHGIAVNPQDSPNRESEA